MRRCLLLVVFTCFLSAFCYSQKFLAIDTYGKAKRLRYYIGQEISLGLSNNEIVSGTISAILDTSFILNTDTIFLSTISFVKTDRLPYGLGIVSALLVNGSLGFMAIDATNRLINEEYPAFRPRVVNTCLTAAGLGLMIPVVLRKRVRINHRRRIHIIDLSL